MLFKINKIWRYCTTKPSYSTSKATKLSMLSILSVSLLQSIATLKLSGLNQERKEKENWTPGKVMLNRIHLINDKLHYCMSV